MCGLTGFLAPPAPADELLSAVRRMSGCLVHRGPDDAGEWVDAEQGVALGFRRLSILDLSPAGHQPMLSASGRFVVVFNGEIYNCEALRSQLLREGLAPEFRGHSDTEVMLAAFEAWGVPAAVSRFVGMFAIALWDRAERTLHLVRDRVGVKPLYFGRSGGVLLFGSELKALRAHPQYAQELDLGALSLYFRYLYVPAPLSIDRGIAKVMPGTIVTIGAGGTTTVETYWSAAEVAARGAANRFGGTAAEAIDAVDALLRDSVALRMVADVPLGVFLSGGIDSSLVSALMQVQSNRPVRTFTIGFGDAAYDEAKYAAAVARHLGTNHTELYVTAEAAMAVIPKLATIYDEPFADSSQIPTYLVSALARQHVTVSLSGDGGDELFAGYPRYFVGSRARTQLARLPQPLRKGLGAALGALPAAFVDRLLGPGSVLPRNLRQSRPGERLKKIGRVLSARSEEEMHLALISHWRDLVIGGIEPQTPLTAPLPHLGSAVERMMFLDQVSYLPDDLLVKVDRASMAVGLESREPLLDHRLVELAWRIPLGMKVRNGQGKWILRRLLDRYVPAELVERPKMGFSVPLGAWLRGPLRPWAEELLSEKALRDDAIIAPQPVRTMWRRHLEGREEGQAHLWAVLMFQAWREEQKRARSGLGG